MISTQTINFVDVYCGGFDRRTNEPWEDEVRVQIWDNRLWDKLTKATGDYNPKEVGGAYCQVLGLAIHQCSLLGFQCDSDIGVYVTDFWRFDPAKMKFQSVRRPYNYGEVSDYIEAYRKPFKQSK